jgi:2-enoate reductase
MTYYINELRSLGVVVSLEKELTSKSVEELRPEVLVLATGAKPILPEVAGSKLKNVLLAEDFLRSPSSIGSTVAVIGGGMIGIEVADLLAEKGKSVIVIEQLDSIGRGTPAITRKELITRLCGNNVKILVSTRAIAIGRAGVLVEHSGERTNISANSVIVASGYRPRRDLAENLDLLDVDFYVIGDCLQPRTIFDAIDDGYRIGCTI